MENVPLDDFDFIVTNYVPRPYLSMWEEAKKTWLYQRNNRYAPYGMNVTHQWTRGRYYFVFREGDDIFVFSFAIPNADGNFFIHKKEIKGG